MEFQFDPDKDKLNLKRHGLPLGLARQMHWDEALVWVDDRFEYDEARMVALVPLESTLYYVAFVDRTEELRRVISLRKAEKKEVLYYVENYN
jgi:uncharacterized protein